MRPVIATRGKSVLQCLLLMAACAGLFRQDVLAADDCRASPVPGINWQDCDKKLIMLDSSDLSGANLTRTDFTSTDLRNSNLTEANFEKAVLVRASFAGSTAKGTRFARIEAYRTDFSQLDAPGAVFSGAELQRSVFTQAKLAGADFTKADLGRSQFDGADVGGSRFSLANLARADFRGAAFASPVDFERAFFFLTRIEGVDLAGATGLTQWQLDMACGDDATVLPAGLKKPASWPCQFQQE
ncbi:pentapeptide repeat-containing protein [Rhizobium sp. SL42]|uniref:pentapeptide repeat-containing protein n=1 Tax=Rhizobium sp. SL42 TaxID=2806346 RepID=UPI003FA75A3D|nr:pentapeptide repeat-containing protein [Rhizobium sp. SL42]